MPHSKYFSFENYSATVAVVWGSFIANPNVDTFTRNPKLYEPMTELVQSEMFWGLFFVAAGITALILNLKSYKRASCFLMAAVFIFMATLFGIADITSQAWGVYGLIGLYNAIYFQIYRHQWKARNL